jgi:hypothetical protein
MTIFIFDLDGTVVDTSHRYRNNAEGHCDLDYWFANSTPEMIAKDTLLPLAATWRRRYAEGHTIVVCTARDFTPLNGVDLGAVYTQFLTDNGLHSHAILHRTMAGPDHKTMGDGDLKTLLLNDWAAREGLAADWRRGAIMFDDNVKVIAKMFADRLWCVNAIEENERIARKLAA